MLKWKKNWQPRSPAAPIPTFVLSRALTRAAYNGFDDAIQRGRAFAKLGVDAVFIEAPQSEAELEEIPRALPNIPLLVNVFKGGKTPMLPVERLATNGIPDRDLPV